MPIQWSGTISSPQQLASVIQGEAATPAGQFAVASVMYNRMTTPGPYIGGGTNDITQVVLPTQFNGYNANPSANAQSLANDLWNGNPPQGGSTGNATFFAAPVQGNAAWAAPGTGLYTSPNSANIGGNYYSDVQGAPTANFQPPVYGGTGSTVATGPVDNSAGGTPASGDPNAVGTGGDSLTAGSYDPYSGDYTSTYSDPNTAFQTPPTTTSTTSPSTTAPSTTAPTTSTSPSTTTGAGNAGTGTPETQGLQQGTISAIQGWITNIESSVGGAFSGAVTAAENAIGTYFAGIGNWFVRGFLIVLGIVILFGAILWLAWDHGGKETAGQVMRAAAA